jgi:hypothetical protein
VWFVADMSLIGLFLFELPQKRGCKHFARRTQTSKIKIDNVYRYVLRLEVEIPQT